MENQRFQAHPADKYPCSLFKAQRILRSLDASFRVIGSGFQLIYSASNPAVNGLRRVRELLSGIRLITGRICLRFGVVNQFVSRRPPLVHLVKLPGKDNSSQNGDCQTVPCETNHRPLKPGHTFFYLLFYLLLGFAELLFGCWLCWRGVFASALNASTAFCLLLVGFPILIHGAFLTIRGGIEIVTQKHLTRGDLCNTVIDMANVLTTDKQIAVIGALAEGSSIRSIERITGVHRDTVMRLGVRVGKGCAALMDAKMRDLGCRYLEFDEIWGFIGKKEKNLTVDDGPEYGDAWTFCAVDAETKLVPAFKVGKRDGATANAFVQDVASRMKNRVQISTDGLRAYVEAIEKAFGTDVDYAQIVKTYIHDESGHPNRRYSAPDIVSTEKKWFAGRPDMRHVSTSYVERLNATTRLHMRRLTRLTLAFSKKRENFEAAVALHFAYYNFVKRNNTLRCTPAMAAGVERDFLTVGDLVEAAS